MKKYYWHAFRHEKLFENQPQPHCQASLNLVWCPVRFKIRILDFD